MDSNRFFRAARCGREEGQTCANFRSVAAATIRWRKHIQSTHSQDVHTSFEFPSGPLCLASVHALECLASSNKLRITGHYGSTGQGAIKLY